MLLHGKASKQRTRIMTETTNFSQHKRLEGKVAIITGGASGIGEATARLFAEHGARAIVIADIQDTLGQNVAKSIGEQCRYMHCDVSSEDQVKALIDSTVETFGKLEIMFSNAGVGKTGEWAQTILDFNLDASDRLFAINTRGMAACVKHAARVMVEGGVKGGSIVCTGSLAASQGLVQFTDYVMSKHAVVGLVKSASKGLGQYGIRVNCISPGGVVTPLSCSEMKLGMKECENFFEGIMDLKGFGAMKAKDIANAVLFLASQDSQFITGHNLIVDGGAKLLL
ncbi:(+)-cis,trans-nepetalactol synthase NEPS2-like [Apium graveolens]|uniref:(+)-cis,trans-nepetalactol synthase NEPS2-like n=1 Tax=Apium graveolens TaxID=4045 RepID=UPI003D78B92F